MAAKVVDKKEKKDLIIEAAMQVFVQKGFTKATINDIAGAAGIGKGTVYEYFSNKDEIIHSAFDYFMRSMQLDFQEVLTNDIPAVKKMEFILTGFAGFLDAGKSMLVELMFDFWAEGIRTQHDKGSLLKQMNEFYHAYREIFADILIEGMRDGSFRKDINPQNMGSFIVGALDGVLVQWLLDKDGFDYKGVVKTVTDILLKGLAASPDESVGR
jgi:AcrR family transcriptional regulator